MKPVIKLLYGANLAVGLAAAVAALALVPRRKRIGRVTVITGGSRGLGLALAHRFGQAGAKLVLAARDQEELDGARRALLQSGSVRHEDDILLVACDVTDQRQAEGLIDLAIRTFGQLDVLINNAGIIEVGPLEDQPLDAYSRAMQTNFFAALYTTYAALSHFLGRRCGNIVNIASIGGKVAVPHMLPYSASKFALVGFSEGLHAELRGKCVRVTTVCPGLMRTGGEAHAHFTGQKAKEERWFQLSATTPFISADAAYAADRIYNAVAAGRAEITITPQAWLAARFAGVAPETTQWISSYVNDWLLPAPTQTGVSARVFAEVGEVADPSPS